MNLYRDSFYHGEAALLFSPEQAQSAVHTVSRRKTRETQTATPREIARLMRDAGLRIERQAKHSGVLTLKRSNASSNNAMCFC